MVWKNNGATCTFHKCNAVGQTYLELGSQLMDLRGKVGMLKMVSKWTQRLQLLEKSCHEFHLFLGTNFTCTLFHAPNFCLSSITVLNFYVSSYKQLEACRSLISTLETKYPGSDFPCLMRASLLHREKHSDKAIELLKVCYFLM